MAEGLSREAAAEFGNLEDADRGWLETFGVLPPEASERAALIQVLDQLSIRGSVDLRTSVSAEEHNAIVDARYNFFEILDLDDAVLRLAERRPALMPPSTFIEQQRMLHRHGLAGKRLSRHHSAILGLSAERIESHLQLLENRGIDATSAINRQPSILSLSAERIESHLQLLEDLGINAARAINRQPNILNYSAERIESHLQLLEDLGINAARAINHLPSILCHSAERIESHLQLLEGRGINPARAVNRLPSILSLSVERIESHLQLLEGRGINPARAVNRLPSILNYSAERIESHLQLLEDCGINATSAINRQPSILSLSAERIESHLQLLENRGINVVRAINRLPSVLGYSAERIESHLQLLEGRGIDAVRAVNRWPSILSLAERNIRTKIIFLRRTASLLKWDYSVEELVNAAPSIMGFNLKKLTILRRLLAEHVHPEARSATPGYIRSGAIIPLEAYMIALADSPADGRLTLSELRSRAHKIQRNNTAPDRKRRAKHLSEHDSAVLGHRICKLYLDYI